MVTNHNNTNVSRRAFEVNDKMLRLIADNFGLIEVLSRFGISMGFGDATVEDVCRKNNVDCPTFLAVVNFVNDGYTLPSSAAEVSLKALTEYLQRSHTYFIDFMLPSIRRKLLDGIRLQTTDISFLILKFFDDYCAEVCTHMQKEENEIFAYTERLMVDDLSDKFSADTYSAHHTEVNSKLSELKRLIILYCPQGSDVNLLNAALYDIFRCEKELESHCRIEDQILIPAIREAEERIAGKKKEER